MLIIDLKSPTCNDWITDFLCPYLYLQPMDAMPPSEPIAPFNLDLTHEANERNFVTALARGMEVLRCFNSNDRHKGLTELTKETGLPKPTVFRLANTLCKLGYLNFSGEREKYFLGAGVLGLGYAFLSKLDVRQHARPLMEELAEETQASVSLGLRDSLEMVYIETVRSSAPIGLQLTIGTRLPITTTSMGRAYLAATSDTDRRFLYDQIRLSDEQNWPRHQIKLNAASAEYEKYGYCTSFGEWEEEINAVAVPFVSADRVLWVLNCGGPAFILTKDKILNSVAAKLVELKNRIHEC